MTLAQFLPAHDANTVALDFGVFIAEQARTHRVSQTAIIAALRPCITPSQPEAFSKPHAPAAQADEGVVSSLASPSNEQIPEAPKPIPDAPINPADVLIQPAEAKTSDQVDGGAVSAVKDANARLENADGVEPPPSASAAPRMRRPRRPGMQEEVARVHAEHRDWPDFKIAEHLDVGSAYVRRTAQRLGLILPPRKNYQKAQQALTTEALKASTVKPAADLKQPPAARPVNAKRASIKQQVGDLHAQHPDWTVAQVAAHLGAKRTTVAVCLSDARAAAREASTIEPAPVPNPQKPVAPPPPPTGSLTDRVTLLHRQHPTWTARMIANELGANADSVSVLLAKVRKAPQAATPAQTEFTGRRDMIDHYAEVARRLGKES